jgi:hypothetical protein
VLAWRLVPGGEHGTRRSRLDLPGLGLPYALVGSSANQAVPAAGLFITGLGQGAIKLTAFTVTFRGLAPEQVAPASSANRILQQLGGVPGTALLALILARAEGTQPGPSAFGHALTRALGLTALAVIPALALPGRPRPRPDARGAGPG